MRRLKYLFLFVLAGFSVAYLINRSPHFLGEEIPIKGDSRLSYD